MDIEQRKANLHKARETVISKCRGKKWVPGDCATEVQTLGWISWRLSKIEDEESGEATLLPSYGVNHEITSLVSDSKAKEHNAQRFKTRS
jgi:hypothetical protein